MFIKEKQTCKTFKIIHTIQVNNPSGLSYFSVSPNGSVRRRREGLKGVSGAKTTSLSLWSVVSYLQQIGGDTFPIYWCRKNVDI